MNEDRNEKGQINPKHSDEKIITAVQDYQPAATSEVADELEVARQSADYRLRKLRKQGTVLSKKIGASLVWFLPKFAGEKTLAAQRDRDETNDTSTNETGDNATPRNPDKPLSDR